MSDAWFGVRQVAGAQAVQTRTQGWAGGFRQQRHPSFDRPSYELTYAFSETPVVECQAPSWKSGDWRCLSELAGDDGGRSGGSLVSRTWRCASGSYLHKACPPFSQTAMMMMLQTQPLREIQGLCHPYRDKLPEGGKQRGRTCARNEGALGRGVKDASLHLKLKSTESKRPLPSLAHSRDIAVFMFPCQQQAWFFTLHHSSREV